MSEQEIKQSLLDQTKEIERLGDTILRAAEGRRPIPTPLGEALKKIGDLTAECGEAISDHLDQALTNETLEAVVSALGAVHAGLDSLVVFQALEGSSYSTTTVAND
ncbi:MAG TPA: hypothetical protein VEQ35_10830 [Beijerinckia sp.]|jgi:hypothetical protein|nr:hypothetical protein [Beijerinckia sp.]